MKTLLALGIATFVIFGCSSTSKPKMANNESTVGTQRTPAGAVPDAILVRGSSLCVIFANSEVTAYVRTTLTGTVRLYGPQPVSQEALAWRGVRIVSKDRGFDYRDLKPGLPKKNFAEIKDKFGQINSYDDLEPADECPFDVRKARD